jgi:hypothetical protein
VGGFRLSVGERTLPHTLGWWQRSQMLRSPDSRIAGRGGCLKVVSEACKSVILRAFVLVFSGSQLRGTSGPEEAQRAWLKEYVDQCRPPSVVRHKRPERASQPSMSPS